ncbi:MAG: amphi-Trp domain-containing protein [Desulfonatronovibrio sp.]
MSKKEIKIKGVMESDSVISCLEDIIAGIKEGKINIKSENQHISLAPAQAMKMEIKAKSGKDKEKLEIELSWKHDQETAMKPVDIYISSQEEEQDNSEDTSTSQDSKKSPAVSGPAIETSDKQSATDQ